MSKTKKGKKPPGYEYWSKRPNSVSSPGRKNKKITHRIERAQAKEKLAEEIKSSENQKEELDIEALALRSASNFGLSMQFYLSHPRTMESVFIDLENLTEEAVEVLLLLYRNEVK
jgi:hypothetical protein